MTTADEKIALVQSLEENPNDWVSRMALADWMEENDQDASKLRKQTPIRVVAGEVLTLTELTGKIIAELDRLEAGDSRHPELIGIRADPELPAGWVRVADSACTVYCDTLSLLTELRSARMPDFSTIDNQDDNYAERDGWYAAWEAIDRVSIKKLWDLQYKITFGPKSATGFATAGRYSNDGIRWFAYPDSSEWLSGHGNCDYTCACETPEEAIDEAEQG